MRSKEEANDYRYFPDPDLLPVVIDEMYLDQVRQELPELPEQKKQRYMEEFDLSAYDAGVLTSSRELADYFEAVVAKTGDAKLSANWISGELAARLNKEELDISESKVTADAYAGLIARIKDNTISGKIAKDVLDAMWNGEGSADEIIESRGLKQITDSGAIEAMVDEVIAANPDQFGQLKGGKDKLMGFFVGQVMKASKGKANPAQVNELMRRKLQE
jgi:aspartyl-tRNA(Asn)/glutamyl-tRNA(Gln) amidotransferase subunit B